MPGPRRRGLALDHLLLCLVLSTSTYPVPGRDVGGSGLPCVDVISVRLPTSRYCPDWGAGVPGFNGFATIDHLLSELRTLSPERTQSRRTGSSVVGSRCGRTLAHGPGYASTPARSRGLFVLASEPTAPRGKFQGGLTPL
jgi:hypothetical protein